MYVNFTIQCGHVCEYFCINKINKKLKEKSTCFTFVTYFTYVRKKSILQVFNDTSNRKDDNLFKKWLKKIKNWVLYELRNLSTTYKLVVFLYRSLQIFELHVSQFRIMISGIIIGDFQKKSNQTNWFPRENVSVSLEQLFHQN